MKVDYSSAKSKSLWVAFSYKQKNRLMQHIDSLEWTFQAIDFYA